MSSLSRPVVARANNVAPLRLVAPVRITRVDSFAGVCPVAQCTEVPGAHTHPAWELARVAGDLNPAAAASWSRETWADFLEDHGVSVAAAIQLLTACADEEGRQRSTDLGTLDVAQAAALLNWIGEDDVMSEADLPRRAGSTR